jgi:hypothetical protein
LVVSWHRRAHHLDTAAGEAKGQGPKGATSDPADQIIRLCTIVGKKVRNEGIGKWEMGNGMLIREDLDIKLTGHNQKNRPLYRSMAEDSLKGTSGWTTCCETSLVTL